MGPSFGEWKIEKKSFLSFLSPPRDRREKKKSKGKYMLLKTSLRTESGCCRRGNHDDVAPLMVGHNYAPSPSLSEHRTLLLMAHRQC